MSRRRATPELAQTPPPLEEAHVAAQQYNRISGFSPINLRQIRTAYMPHTAAQRISAAYERLPSHQRSAIPAYRQLASEVERQADFLQRPQSRGGMGVTFHVTEHDPYSGPGDMVRDLAENRRMQIFHTSEDQAHPYFSADQNNLFRGVHDILGHAASGGGFQRHGEETAYLHHAAMFSPLARRALATETRGQNTWHITRGRSQDFPEQKVGVLPESWMHSAVPITGRARRGEARTAIHQARQFNIEGV